LNSSPLILLPLTLRPSCLHRNGQTSHERLPVSMQDTWIPIKVNAVLAVRILIRRSFTPDTARQLKKEWLATQKIKATYRAEKRRLGLGKPGVSTDSSARDGAPEVNGDAAETQPPDEDLSDHDTSGQSSLGDDVNPHPIVQDAQSTHGEGESGTGRLKGKGKTAVSTQPASAAPSLRAMAREAYSPASLHTHKSNPLHRQQHGKDYARRRVEAAATRGGNRGERGVTGARGQGRGQPDMAKRMGVLLEKIKRTT
jgi:hypothetical protein